MRALIANLSHAARNGHGATIGGGDFGPDELRQAARMLETSGDMLRALQRLAHPAADDTDLQFALEVIAQATGAGHAQH